MQHIHQERLEVRTAGRDCLDITGELGAVIARSGIKTGVATLFIQHTSASLLIQENADPAVLRDLARWITKLAPESGDWEHDDEGPDDMPSHARAALLRTSETIPITEGKLALGTWQGVYVIEHRARPHVRRVVVHVAGA